MRFKRCFSLERCFVINIALEQSSVDFMGFWGMYRLLRLAYFVLWVFMAYKAYSGERVVLPVIGPLAEKQA